MQFTTTATRNATSIRTAESQRNRRISGNGVLWAIQGLLAVLFVFAGASKLVLPADDLVGDTGLPVLFLRFIGVCEAAGGLGLVLPGIVRRQAYLTPLAAAGL